jgi:hypothetical protein
LQLEATDGVCVSPLPTGDGRKLSNAERDLSRKPSHIEKKLQKAAQLCRHCLFSLDCFLAAG